LSIPSAATPRGTRGFPGRFLAFTLLKKVKFKFKIKVKVKVKGKGKSKDKGKGKGKGKR